MKCVLFYDKSGMGKEKDVREQYHEENAGGFFKYYELEQFEDALRRAHYGQATVSYGQETVCRISGAEGDIFTPPANEGPGRYIFLRDLTTRAWRTRSSSPTASGWT